MASSDPKRILVVSGHYSADGRDEWLIDELVREFVRCGDTVDLLLHDTQRVRPRAQGWRSPLGVRVWSVGPTKRRTSFLPKVLNYAASAVRLHTSGYRSIRRNRYDLCIFTSIGILSAGVPRRIRSAGVASRLVFILWDFFPIHQIEIGRIRQKSIAGVLRQAELRCISNADAIAVMTPRNAEFLRAYHPELDTRTIIVPPWAEAGKRADAGQRKYDEFTVVFGGQLAPGRGVDSLLVAACELESRGSPAQILIIGDGPSRPPLEEYARRKGLVNVQFHDPLPRADYRDLLTRVHVGVAITVAGVSIPSFPSKISGYCAAALPVIACLETTSDAGKILKESGAGLSVDAGDWLALANAIETLRREHDEGRLAARSASAFTYFERDLSVQVAASRLKFWD